MEEQEKKGGSGKLLKFLSILIVVVLVILFAMDNIDNVSLGLVFTRTNAPLTAIIISSFLLGFLISVLIFSVSAFRRRKELRKKDKEIQHLEERLSSSYTKIDDLSDKGE